MAKWTENINGEPDTPRDVSPVRGRVLGNTTIEIWHGAGCLAYIISTIIKDNGDTFLTHNMATNYSVPAAKQLEDEFGLVKADRHKQKEHNDLKPSTAQKAVYGRSETKRSITSVLDSILPAYKFTSLAELNAVLKYYNVLADQGSENSRMYKNNGLVYRILDDEGNKVGVPVKASDFYMKPTMKNLQIRFAQNGPLKEPHKQRIKNAIDLALLKPSVETAKQLQEVLKRDNIQLVLRQNRDGLISDLIVVDHIKKVVFTGSDLGTKYSAAQILERLPGKATTEATSHAQSQVVQLAIKQQPSHRATPLDQPKSKPQHADKKEDLGREPNDTQAVQPSSGKSVLEALLKAEAGADNAPMEQPIQKKKRKKKRLHL